jgi:hypothetical protein
MNQEDREYVDKNFDFFVRNSVMNSGNKELAKTLKPNYDEIEDYFNISFKDVEERDNRLNFSIYAWVTDNLEDDE